MSGPPAELFPRLGIGPCAYLGHHRNNGFACYKSSDPDRQMEGRLRTEPLGERGQPLSRLGRLIVHDIVDVARLAAFDRLDGRRCGITDMQERPPTAAVADQRRTATSNQLYRGR